MGMDVDDSDSNSLDATKEGDKNDTTNVVEAEGSAVEENVIKDEEELGAPKFNAKGKFIRYEKRELEEDNPAIMQPLDDAISSQSHIGYCNRKCGIWISLLLITFAVVIAIAFYSGEKVGESRGQSEESNLQSSDKHTHHPKKEHSCRNCPPTSSPVVSSVSDPIINRPFKPGQTKPGSAAESSGSIMTEITPWSEGGDIRIGASSVSTIIRSNPDYRWGGVKELSVESDEQISYIRFDLSSINRFMSGSNIDLDISKVILWLYMTTHQDEEESIKVDMLPAAGRWEDSSVSWNKTPDAKDAFYVDSFVAKGVEVGLVLIQVDVTSVFINSSYDTVTFKLYAEPTSNDVYSFASREWEEGESIPELVVTMSA